MNNNQDSYLSSLGCVFPQNEYELDLFEKQNENMDFKLNESDLDPYSILKSIKADIPIRSKSRNFFQRSVLAAKITHDCYQEITFGRVKFQKMVYLCENVSKMNFATNYSKQAAGPMDNRFIYSIQKHFEKQKWFNTIKESSTNKVHFQPLENVDGYKKYYELYYKDVSNEIQKLIETFKTWKSDDVELVATIHSCWCEIKNENLDFSEDTLITKVYAWHEKKQRFSEKRIKQFIDWMRDNNLHPN